MNRREFVALGAAYQRPVTERRRPDQDTFVASASMSSTPLVGMVPSDFKGSEDHDGTAVAGLAEPRPVDSAIQGAHLEAMFGKAVGLCEDKRLGLKSLLDPGDWVVILISLDTRPGGEFQPGAMTDPRLVRCLAEYLAANRLGRRFTFATCLGAMAERCWTTDWGGVYDGISFRKVADEATRRHPGCRFELSDLERDQIVEAEVPGAGTGSKGVAARLRVPRSILQCDRLISVAPLRICPRLGARLTIGNYLGIAPRAIYGGDLAKLASHGSLEEALIDLYAYHPGDFAIAGGGWGLEAGPAQDGKPASVRHNLLIAGRNPLAVDAVAASVMGLDAGAIDHLKRAEMEGFGIRDTDSIWVRGREVEQVRRPYRRPAGGLP